jgi:hypothetical protein
MYTYCFADPYLKASNQISVPWMSDYLQNLITCLQEETKEEQITIPGTTFSPLCTYFFTVGPVGFATVGTAAYRLIVPPCFGSHLSPPGALRAQMSRETSGRERENYGREMAELNLAYNRDFHGSCTDRRLYFP